MKISGILVVIILTVCICSFSSCGDDGDAPVLSPEDWVISTDNVQYGGWTDYISDDKYVVSSGGFYTNQTSKYNIATGNITGVCMRPDCEHRSSIKLHIQSEYCRIPNLSRLFFIKDEKVYYRYRTTYRDQEIIDENAVVTPVITEVFGCYDMSTGEYRDIMKLENKDYEQMYNFYYRGDYIYYLRNISRVEEPTSIDDYDLTLCYMNFDDYNESRLCIIDGDGKFQKGIIPFLIAVVDDTVYFASTDTGTLFSIKTDGTDFEYIIDDGNGFYGVFDAYGTFYLDDYFYFSVYAYEYDSAVTTPQALIMYRVNRKTKKLERISDDYAEWMFVSDNKIYYEMAKQQPTEEQLVESSPYEHSHTIKQMDHNGENVEAVGTYKWPYVSLSKVWGAGECLFFRTGYNENYDGGAISAFCIKLNVVDGTYEEINKAEDLE